MKTNRVLGACLVVGLSAVAVGCGGHGSKEVAGPSYPTNDYGYGYGRDAAKSAPSPGLEESYAAPPATAAPSGGATSTTVPMDAPPTPPRPRAEADERSASVSPSSQPVPRERPGLGTEWGETRTSEVHEVPFVRADGDRPAGVATIHYNDRAGVDALVAFRDRRSTAREIRTAGGFVTVAILDSADEPLETIHTGDRNYVVGHAGQRYSIAITNHSDRRFEAVASVDGLDVMSGQPAGFEQRGYLVGPFSTVQIDGFRQSDREVAAFRFASVSESYAAQTGHARNVGVIGVALFREAGAVWTPEELRRRDTADPFPSKYALPPWQR